MYQPSPSLSTLSVLSRAAPPVPCPRWPRHTPPRGWPGGGWPGRTNGRLNHLPLQVVKAFPFRIIPFLISFHSSLAVVLSPQSSVYKQGLFVSQIHSHTCLLLLACWPGVYCKVQLLVHTRARGVLSPSWHCAVTHCLHFKRNYKNFIHFQEFCNIFINPSAEFINIVERS